VFNELPLKGIILWNSHAFNLTDKDGKLEAWFNLEFAPPDQQRIPTVNIFDADAIFQMQAAPFTTDEVCHIQTFPAASNVFELTSHMHKRGKRFRMFRGAWRCNGGSRNGAACSPFGPDLA
jgi:hypothetical protein